jgi:hypothetical protein
MGWAATVSDHGQRTECSGSETKVRSKVRPFCLTGPQVRFGVRARPASVDLDVWVRLEVPRLPFRAVESADVVRPRGGPVVEIGAGEDGCAGNPSKRLGVLAKELTTRAHRKERPIVFEAHSFGGLVLKYVCARVP